ncbi:MAG: hypothetical protein OES26_25885 [Gammaproteobacteria bacterium]|nr:hypothetical protein [Gammaproteobacteria bacterium]
MKHNDPCFRFLFAVLAIAIFLSACGGDRGSGFVPPIELPDTLIPPSTPPVTRMVYSVINPDDTYDIYSTAIDSASTLILLAKAAQFWTIADGLVIIRDSTGFGRIPASGGTAVYWTDTQNSFLNTVVGRSVISEKSTSNGVEIHVSTLDTTDSFKLAGGSNVRNNYLGNTSGRVVYKSCVYDPDLERCVAPQLHAVAFDGTGDVMLIAGTTQFAGIHGDSGVLYTRYENGQHRLYLGSVFNNTATLLHSTMNQIEIIRSLPNGQISFGEWHDNDETPRDSYVVNSDGLGLRQVSASVQDEVVTGVTATRLIYVNGQAGAYDLYSEKFDGTQTALLASLGNVRLVHITNQGKVVFANRTGTGLQTDDDLYIIDEDGVHLTAIAVNVGQHEFFWGEAPDSRLIYTTQTDHTAQTDLHSVLPDGTGTAVIADSPDYESFWNVTKDNEVIYSRFVNLQQTDLYAASTIGQNTRALAQDPLYEVFHAIVE